MSTVGNNGSKWTHFMRYTGCWQHLTEVQGHQTYCTIHIAESMDLYACGQIKIENKMQFSCLISNRNTGTFL